jgi:hypothetical protein
MPGWERSEGARAEVKEAKRLGKEIVQKKSLDKSKGKC